MNILRDINRGEEINTTYITLGYLNKKLRQKELRNWFQINITHTRNRQG